MHDSWIGVCKNDENGAFLVCTCGEYQRHLRPCACISAIKGFTSLEPFTDFGSKHWALNVDMLEAREHSSERPLADEGKRSGPTTKGVPGEQLKEHTETKTSPGPWWGIENRESAMDWQNIVTEVLEKAPLETRNSGEDWSGESVAITDDDYDDGDLDGENVNVETDHHQQQLQPTAPSFQGDSTNPRYNDMKNYTENMSTWLAVSTSRLQNREDRATLLAMTQDYTRLNLIPAKSPQKARKKPQKARKKPANNPPRAPFHSP